MTMTLPCNDHPCVMNISCLVSFRPCNHTIMTVIISSIFHMSKI